MAKPVRLQLQSSKMAIHQGSRTGKHRKYPTVEVRSYSFPPGEIAIDVIGTSEETCRAVTWTMRPNDAIRFADTIRAAANAHLATTPENDKRSSPVRSESPETSQ